MADGYRYRLRFDVEIEASGMHEAVPIANRLTTTLSHDGPVRKVISAHPHHLNRGELKGPHESLDGTKSDG